MGSLKQSAPVNAGGIRVFNVAKCREAMLNNGTNMEKWGHKGDNRLTT